MSGGIFVLAGDGLVPLHEEPYGSEDLLQTLLASYPELIAGTDDAIAPRWLLVKRELGVPDGEAGGDRWSLDHLFLDQDAVPTLVEVKRSDDTRIRREVVGQMLDYAANGVVYWPAERLRAEFETRCAMEGEEPRDVFSARLGDELDPERFWNDVEQNLHAGRVRLVFVSDRIPAELRRVIEFLNERMSPTEVLGIEIKQYVGDGDLKTLVPRVVGQTEQARMQKVGGTRAQTGDVEWNYYEQELAPQQLAIVREIYNRMEKAVSERGLTWQPKLKTGYLGFTRPGPYYCCGVNVRKESPIEFWVKLPLPPEELRSAGSDVSDLYPQLDRRWDSRSKVWAWKVPAVELIPDITPAVELTSRYQPPSGPMLRPSS